jgi:hypothetical protein
MKLWKCFGSITRKANILKKRHKNALYLPKENIYNQLATYTGPTVICQIGDFSIAADLKKKNLEPVYYLNACTYNCEIYQKLQYDFGIVDHKQELSEVLLTGAVIVLDGIPISDRCHILKFVTQIMNENFLFQHFFIILVTKDLNTKEIIDEAIEDAAKGVSTFFLVEV